MVILAILIIVYIMIGYGLFLNTLSEEYIKSVWTPIIWFLWIIVLWLPYGVYSYLKEGQRMNLDEKIKQHIPQDELLAQLAEECAELSQAALKLRRALTGINPTPVTAEEARKNLVEETADVYNVLGLLLDAEDNAEIYDIIRRKKARWVKRLEG